MEKKKQVSKTPKKTTKKVTKNVTTKKVEKKTKKKKGFTLIELLAVIIILGILMIIAIPSVTRYINDSRKSTYIDTAKGIISGARNLVNEGKLQMFDTDTTYYIPTDCIKTETESRSPYGDFDKSYVLVTYDGKGYNYYWVSRDETGQGIPEPVAVSDLDEDDIESDINQNYIKTNVTKDGTNKVLVLDKEKCSTFSNGMPRAEETVKEKATEADQIINIDDEIYIYKGKQPNNYVIFNGETWRIMGVYGNQLKLIKNSSIGEKQYNATIRKIWENSTLEKYLNSEAEGGYIYGLSSEAQNMLDEGIWYVNPLDYRYNAIEAWNGAKNGITIRRKVGMMASYEYLYAASDSSCLNVSGFDFDNGSTYCSSKDWMNLIEFWWFINPAHDTNWCILFSWRGAITRTGNSWTDELLDVIPAVYLKPTVMITGGTGTKSDPYRLGL